MSLRKYTPEERKAYRIEKRRLAPATARKRLIKRLDKAFGDYIKARDGFQCVVCKSLNRPMRGQAQCGHIFSRVAHSTRWDERNSHCQCSGCNMSHEYNSWPYMQWALDTLGREVMDDLQRKWNKPKKFENWQLQEMINEFEFKTQKIKEQSAVKL